MATRPFYVTTPIYYVNDLPHIGHVYTTIVADTVARYQRLRGRDVWFLTGTDEHGQNIERAAAREGIAPLTLADRVVERYHQHWREYRVSHDDFIRTTEARHRRGVERMIERLAAAGDLYVARHEGWYCSACESFYTEKELGPQRLCPVHGTTAEWKSEDNVFFRLAKYQQRLLDWYDRQPAPVQPATRLNEVRSFVASGLRDLSVSRNLSWGIPFPGHPGQVVYVWLDALSNYVTALGFGDDEAERDGKFARFWATPEAQRLHLVGKDILRFHTVYWPAFLMSAGLALPDTVWAHGWWLRDDRKISKSAGNLVRPDELVARFGADPMRYFLLREMPFGQDASFSDEAFIGRFNSDLANDLGNTASRVITLARGAFDGRTPPVPCDDNPLKALAEGEVVPGYLQAMEEMAFHRALEQLWRLLAEANQYLVAREPWKLVKTEGPTDKLSRILWNGLEAVRIVATGLLPFMPAVAPQVLAAIGVAEPPGSLDALAWGGTPTSAPLAEPSPIFPRIDKLAYFAPVAKQETQMSHDPEVPPSSSPTSPPAPDPAPAGPDASPATAPTAPPAPPVAAVPRIDIGQFAAVQLRVATVLRAQPVPKSSKLLELAVDLGDETRTVVAGIGKAYSAESLVGRQVIVVANLAPAKLMGVESQGMVLAADGETGPVLLQPSAAVPNGTRVK